MTIAWKEDTPPEKVSSIGHLLARIREIASETTVDSGIAALLQRDSGEELTAIVAGGRWWFFWTPSDYTDRALGSYHSTSATGSLASYRLPSPNDLIPFFLFGHHGEVDFREGVDDETGITAILQFFSATGRPDILTWLPD